MKAIQTYWFKPFYEQNHERLWGGFSAEKYFWYSLAISSACLRKNFDELVFYTDSIGHEVVTNLKLPYNRIEIVEDDFNDMSSDLWVSAKLKVYALQKSPFLHIDADAFFWGKLPESMRLAKIVIQRAEDSVEERKYYAALDSLLRDHLKYLPHDFGNYSAAAIPAFNCGIFGGNDCELIQRYCKGALDIINDSENAVPWVNLAQNLKDPLTPLALNCAVEQMYLARFLEKQNIQPFSLVNELGAHAMNQFSHLSGDAKQSASALAILESRMSSDLPLLKSRIDQRF